MHLDKLHPELRKTYSRIPAVPFHNPVVLTLLKVLSAIPRKAKPTPGVSVVNKQLKTASVRIYRPEGELSGAGMFWIHGGGYIIGDATVNDGECAQYARDFKMVVVSVEYRLAPRHKFPLGLDDCFEAWQWLVDNAQELGVSPDRLVISGQSAGGGLAAALVQRVFDSGGTQPVGQALLCPMLDDRTAANTELDAVKNRLWNNKNNRGGWTYYLGVAPGRSDLPPYAAPARREDLSGLPPAWVGVGDVDLFYQEDCDYAARLTAAGVPCTLKVTPGAPHAFEMLAPDTSVAKDFTASNYQFLREVLALPS